MKTKLLFSFLMLFVGVGTMAQDLHTHANAVSVSNEANSTTGWSGLATLTSDSSDPQSGNFAIRAVSTANDGRTVSYQFTAVIGQDYTIRIWAKYGPRVNNNSSGAFAVWTGLSGWEVTPITGTDWREYVFNVTATSVNPTIMAYTNNYATRFVAGNTILIDNVSIMPAGVTDTQAPTAPSNLVANGTTATTTNLSWAASTDNVGVTGYTILQNGTSIGATNGATSYNVTGLVQNTSYAFTVTANDAAGNVSLPSNTANVSTQTTVDTQAPTAPTNLLASGTSSSATDLSWTASTDNVGVAGYTILRDGTSIGTTNGATTFNVTGLSQNTSYDFTVTANDLAGNVSSPSNALSVTTTGSGTGLIDYTSENSNLITVDWTAKDLFADGNLGIGTTDTHGYRLAVAGNMVAEEINVKLQVNWPDFVFEKDYDLPSLREVEEHILQKGYLLDMPSAQEVEKEGIDIGTMNAKLLQKIEELTLYAIEQEKKIQSLERESTRIDSLSEKLMNLEEALKANLK